MYNGYAHIEPKEFPSIQQHNKNKFILMVLCTYKTRSVQKSYLFVN